LGLFLRPEARSGRPSLKTIRVGPLAPTSQLRRFKDRSGTSYKRWKITNEDWRNRKRWEDYTVAVNDMVERTSTKIAPWTLVEGNDKNFARIRVLRTLAERLDDRLKK